LTHVHPFFDDVTNLINDGSVFSAKWHDTLTDNGEALITLPGRGVATHCGANQLLGKKWCRPAKE
jgi:hypothetical protein